MVSVLNLIQPLIAFKSSTNFGLIWDFQARTPSSRTPTVLICKRHFLTTVMETMMSSGQKITKPLILNASLSIGKQNGHSMTRTITNVAFAKNGVTAKQIA